MADVILPQGTHEVERDQQKSPRVTVPRLKDYAYEREQQLITQRALFEKLNYRRYERHHSLGHVMQTIGDSYRRGGIVWWVSWVAYLYFATRMFR